MGRVIMPAWQKRQPRVQPRMISMEMRSCTERAWGTTGRVAMGTELKSNTDAPLTTAGTSSKRGVRPRKGPLRPSKAGSYRAGT